MISLACFKEWKLIRRLALVGVIVYGYQYVPVAWAWVNPPFIGHSIEVETEDGVPVRVRERRDIKYDAVIRWRVRAIHEELEEVICIQPVAGPKEETYTSGKARNLFSSMRWEQYTADWDKGCLHEMRSHPGNYSLETQREARVLWSWVPLDPVTTVTTFYVAPIPQPKPETLKGGES